MANDSLTTIEYRFRFRDGLEKVFPVRLRRPDLELVREGAAPHPEWTRLAHHRCPNCPLPPGPDAWCPAATGLAELIDAFRECLSTEVVEIVIQMESREYCRRAPVQYGLSALMGLLMATSGCPVMDRYRPMVHTHLPFASIEETMFRTVSMYLLAQYYRRQRGLEPDWDLDRLVEFFEEVGQVNQSFARRLMSINPKDASLNALANLDCFALATSFSITSDRLAELEPLFQAYTRPDAG